MRIALAAAALLLATSCSSETAYLKNPATGEAATCGPYSLRGLGATAQALALRGCIDDYQRQGFIRVSAPD